MRLNNDKLVQDFYHPLYCFALGLSKSEADAGDLVQQTFLKWGQKGHQLRDKSKVKAWLFTTLHREFLSVHRKRTKFQMINMESAPELPSIPSVAVDSLDVRFAVDALQQMDDRLGSTLSLFYLNDKSYKEIASTLGIPIGTVMSRISRGKAKLREILGTKVLASG